MSISATVLVVAKIWQPCSKKYHIANSPPLSNRSVVY